MKSYIIMIYLILIISSPCTSQNSNNSLERITNFKKQCIDVIEKKIELKKSILGKTIIIENCYSIITLSVDTLIKYIEIEKSQIPYCEIRDKFYMEFLNILHQRK